MSDNEPTSKPKSKTMTFGKARAVDGSVLVVHEWNDTSGANIEVYASYALAIEDISISTADYATVVDLESKTMQLVDRCAGGDE